jgi:hypothetical protein
MEGTREALVVMASGTNASPDAGGGLGSDRRGSSRDCSSSHKLIHSGRQVSRSDSHLLRLRTKLLDKAFRFMKTIRQFRWVSV